MTRHIEPPFTAVLKPSRRLKQLLLAVHGLAVVASIANALPSAYKVLAAAAVTTHFGYSMKKLRLPLSSIRYTDTSGWEIGKGAAFEPVDILGSSVLTPFAIWLHLKTRSRNRVFANARKNILIMSDALNEDDYRRLLVKLKISAAK